MLLFALFGCPTEAPLPPATIPLVAEAGEPRVIPVGVAIKLDGRASTGAVDWLWNMGDGSTYTTPAPTHIYTQPGNYTAVLQVTDGGGSTQIDSTPVLAHPILADLVPTVSSTLALQDGRVTGVVSDANTLFVADADGVTTVQACSGGSPVGLVATPQLSLLCDGPLPKLVHLPTDPLLIEEVELPPASRPRGLVYSDGGWWVSLSGTGQLARIEGDSAPVYTDVGPDPRSLLALPSGPVAARLRSGTEFGEIYGPAGPIAIPYDPGPDSDTGNRGVPNLLTLAPSPDGKTLYAGGTLSNTARGEVRDGVDLSFETTVRAFVSIIDLPTGVERVRHQFDDQGQVGALVVSPLGNLVYCAFPSTHTVIVIDAFTGELVGSLIDIGRGVDGMLLSPDGRTLYINATLDREVRAYDVSDLGAVPPLLWSQRSVTDDPLSPQVLRGKQLFHDSADIRIASAGYISCAVCHPEGDQDGQTWDFTGRGEGLRNTITLLGHAGTDMGPVHWTGNFDEIQDFEHDIRGPFGGSGLMTDAEFAQADTPLGPPKAGLSADLDALAAYVESLDQFPASPFPAPLGGDVLFAAQGCEECHPPPRFTDSALDLRHDVGTLDADAGQRLGGPLDGFDTPTLLGVWDSGPWLHDGGAPTLEAAISAHTDAPTDPAIVSELADYIRSL